jgi:hypothetical protein
MRAFARTNRVALALLAAVVATPLAGQENNAESSEQVPLFANRAPLQVRIEAPLTTLMNVRPVDEYLDGTFTYTDADGNDVVLDLKLRSRGKTRRRKETCNFSPIRLNFKKKQVEGTEFEGQDKLKLVTHCQNTKPSYEQLILREYLAYRILQLFTEKSFGARLFHVTYTDTEGRRERTRFGFVIEDEDALADRLGMEVRKISRIEHENIDADYENLINVYQFVIGNTDYSLIKGPDDDECCHNAVLYSATEEPPYFAIPYDLDFSGIVDAPYAGTNRNFRLSSVRERLYRGLCDNNDLLAGTIQRFRDRKSDIYAIIDEMTMLSRNSRSATTRFLNQFYDRIDNDAYIQEEFYDGCN